MKLTLITTTFLQLATFIATCITLALDNNIVPLKWKALAGVVASALVYLTHQAAGNRNPNGTTAALPYAAGVEELRSAAQAAYEAHRASHPELPPFNTLAADAKLLWHGIAQAAVIVQSERQSAASAAK
jgi:hypothetical protein